MRAIKWWRKRLRGVIVWFFAISVNLSQEIQMLKRDMNIADYDPELYAAIQEETLRQEEHIELIASENYTSRV